MNILIGNTSQLSYYFPQDYIRVSSRNIDFDFIKKNKVDTVHLLFAEQRTFLNRDEKFFTDVNVEYTLSIINKIKDFTKKNLNASPYLTCSIEINSILLFTLDIRTNTTT
jgi:hypothetical protein